MASNHLEIAAALKNPTASIVTVIPQKLHTVLLETLSANYMGLYETYTPNLDFLKELRKNKTIPK